MHHPSQDPHPHPTRLILQELNIVMITFHYLQSLHNCLIIIYKTEASIYECIFFILLFFFLLFSVILGVSLFSVYNNWVRLSGILSVRQGEGYSLIM